jgi:hypothetical protein
MPLEMDDLLHTLHLKKLPEPLPLELVPPLALLLRNHLR